MAVVPLRIGTWNVEYARGVDRNRRRLEHLRRLAADIWVLTETHDDLDLGPTHVAVRSDQRCTAPGGRWTTVWTSLPVLERLPTVDPRRCVAARLDGGAQGEIVVYGTVLPWNGDVGPHADDPARGWQEFMRVVPEQGDEWRALRERFPDATLVVAGDLNHDLGGEHYYGTKVGRELLRDHLRAAGLVCVTTTDRFDRSLVRDPPIDHVCVGAGRGRAVVASVEGWNREVDDVRLSDHGGTLAVVAVGAVPGP